MPNSPALALVPPPQRVLVNEADAMNAHVGILLAQPAVILPPEMLQPRAQ